MASGKGTKLIFCKNVLVMEIVGTYFTQMKLYVVAQIGDDVVLRHTPRFHGAKTVPNC